MRWNAVMFVAALGIAAVFGCEKPQPAEQVAQDPYAASDTMEPDYYAASATRESAIEPAPAGVGTGEPLVLVTDEPPASRTHIVAKGDTLYSLARHYYNDQRRWKDIYEANRGVIGGPDLVKIGQELVIP